MTNFDAAISFLRTGAETHLNNAARWDELKEYSAADDRRKIAKELTASSRVLEAAGEMPQAKERLLPHFEELAHIQCFYCKGIRAILAALPDKEK